MLSNFRKLSDNFFTKIILLLIVVSFALWGVGDMIGQSNKPTVAKVGDIDISADEYYQSLQKLRANMGEFFSNEIVKQLNLLELTLQELIVKKLFKLESNFLHIEIGDDAVKQIIAKDESFQNESGLFDAAIFERKLQQMRISEKKLIDEMRDMVAEDILKKTIAMSANFPEKYYDLLFHEEFKQRKILIFKIEEDQVTDISSATEDQIKGYYEANLNKYLAPEYRRFDYILVDKQAVDASSQVSEDDLRASYLQRQKQLMTPEKRDIWQLLYEDKSSAEQAYSLLRGGKKFDEVVKLVQPINQSNLSLGMIAKHQFNFKTADIFNLAKGDFTSPIKTDFGWHIFMVNEIKPAFVPAFAELRKTLEADLINEKKQKTLQNLLEQLEDGLAANSDLATIAQNLKLEILSSNQVDESGKRADNTIDFAAENYQNMLKAAFSLEVGKTSELLQLKDGNYVVLTLRDIVPARARLLDEVRGTVTNDLLLEKIAQAKRAFAEVVAADLHEAKPQNISQANAILRKHNIAKTEVMLVTRDGVIVSEDAKKQKQPELSSEVYEKLFAAKQPMSVLDYVADGETLLGGIYIDEIKPDKTKQKLQYQELKARIDKHYQEEILSQYIYSLQKRHQISRDGKMIKMVNERF